MAVITLIGGLVAASCGSSGTDPAEPACEPSLAAGVGQRTIDHEGTAREYQVAVPDGTPRGIIFDFHGAGGTIADQDEVTRLSTAGPRRGFVVVTPQGLGNPARWTVPGLPGPDDVALVEAIDAQVRAEACVEGPTIATGISAGASMAVQLACTSDLVSIIAPVAGISLYRRCPTGPPVATITYHGTEDQFVPYVGPDGWEETEQQPDTYVIGDVRASAAAFAERAGCAATTTERPLGDDTTITAYDCPEAPVELFTIRGGGHTHPGEHALGVYLANGLTTSLGPTTTTFDGTDEMLDFFDRVLGEGA